MALLQDPLPRSKDDSPSSTSPRSRIPQGPPAQQSSNATSAFLFPSHQPHSASSSSSPRTLPIPQTSISHFLPQQPPHAMPPRNHAHRHSISHHPSLNRSDSTPALQTPMAPTPMNRPNPMRTITTPLMAPHENAGPSSANGTGEYLFNNATGSRLAGGSTSGNTSGRDDGEREELTTKGLKRKRLAKACSACHKNKRRCDGFAPCSNCEFSSRPCLYVNAQGEVIPPPRVRDPTANKQGSDPVDSDGYSNTHKSSKPNGNSSPSGQDDGAPNKSNGNAGAPKGGPGSQMGGSAKEDEAQDGRRRYTGPLDAVDRDPTLSAELIDIFFNHIHPYAMMIHAPTFQYRLYIGRMSPLLLDAIYALSAHLCESPTLLNTLSPDTLPWQRGEAFAARAHPSAKRVAVQRAAWSKEECEMDKGTWEETEFVQALYLLSVYHGTSRQPKLGLQFLDAAIEIFRPTQPTSLHPPSRRIGLNSIEYLTLAECRHKTFWMLVLQDLCAAANGRPKKYKDSEVYNIALPGDESQWDRWGGGGSSGRVEAKRDALQIGTGTWTGWEGEIGEFGHLMRALVVFADVMSMVNAAADSGTPASIPRALQLERVVKTWGQTLPSGMLFDERNLAHAVQRINSPIAAVSRSGWIFAYMHAVAECGMFFLQATLATGGAGIEITVSRQTQAVDNISVIMDAIGVRGRRGPLFTFPLLVISDWYDHLRSNPAAPTPQQILLGERLPAWWAEVTRNWGCDRASQLHPPVYSQSTFHPTTRHPQHLTNAHHGTPLRGTQPMSTTTPLSPPPSSLPTQPTPGLGLYGTTMSQPSSIRSMATLQSPTPSLTPSYLHRASDAGMSVTSTTATIPTPRSGIVPTASTPRYSHASHGSMGHLPVPNVVRQRANTLSNPGAGDSARNAFAFSPVFTSPSPNNRDFQEFKESRERRGSGRLLPPLGSTSTTAAAESSALSIQSKAGIRLPPLPAQLPSHGSLQLSSMSLEGPSPRSEAPFKFPSFWNSGSGTGPSVGERSRASMSGVSGGIGESPRFGSYLRDVREKDKLAETYSPGKRGREDESRSRSTEKPSKRERTVSPSSNGQKANEQGSRVKMEMDDEDVTGPVGIEALISAAEQHGKELANGSG